MHDNDPPFSSAAAAKAAAWARYRRLMKLMLAVAIVAVVGANAYLLLSDGAEQITWHMLIATTVGVFLSVALAAALMGLVFVSNAAGYDEAVNDIEEHKE